MTTKTNKRLQQNQSNNLGKLPIWDLGDLYNSTKDNKITSDLNFIKKASKKLEKKYEGKIRNLNSEKLLKAIIELEKIDEKIDRVMSYAYLLYAENIENEKNKIFFQQMQETITKYSSSLIFFSLELNKIENKKLKKLLKNKKLKEFDTWIANARTFKPHQLEKKLENFIGQFCRKLLGYAIGRELKLSDEPLVSAIQKKLRENNYHFSVAIEMIVQSRQFREIRGKSSYKSTATNY